MGELTNFNLSVGSSQTLLWEALAQGADWPLVFNGKVHDVLPAAEQWQEIVKSAHACGEPGIIFLIPSKKQPPTPQQVKLHQPMR